MKKNSKKLPSKLINGGGYVVIYAAILFYASFVYFPRWKAPGSEAVISWDVSGYYIYLPAMFIYGDVKELKFKEDIWKKYRPTPAFDQAFRHPKTGNYVFKYSCGQAISFLPSFLIAHLAANVLGYPTDGFSQPYQLMISLGGLLISFLGLFYLRKSLLRFFSDKVVGMTLLIIVLGSNYLEYASVSAAMTHNTLFTIYSLLLYHTFSFYEKPTYWRAAMIGALMGWATIIRPTEIISVLLPLLLLVKLLPFGNGSQKERIQLIASHWKKLILAALLGFLVISLQLGYWKYVSGDWFVYSYQNEGFDWLHPHIWNFLFSYKCGWLVYSPAMVFSLLGFYFLGKKNKGLLFPALMFSVLFMYIAFSWSIWWYGGTLGQRTMVQAYPVLAFPLAAFVDKIIKTKWLKYIICIICSIFIYLNIWWVHQAHKGGLFQTEQMTKAYFWRVLGRFDYNTENLKLLDTDEDFRGERRNIKMMVTNDFENETLDHPCPVSAIQGNHSVCLDKPDKSSPITYAVLKTGDAQWVRATATFKCWARDWADWMMPQFIVRFYDNGIIVKERLVRVSRFLEPDKNKVVYLDVKCPNGNFDLVGVYCWNAHSEHELAFDNLIIEQFD